MLDAADQQQRNAQNKPLAGPAKQITASNLILKLRTVAFPAALMRTLIFQPAQCSGVDPPFASRMNPNEARVRNEPEYQGGGFGWSGTDSGCRQVDGSERLSKSVSAGRRGFRAMVNQTRPKRLSMGMPLELLYRRRPWI